MMNKLMLGALEFCDLPELNITRLNIRIDTGAQTSSLHVDNIVEFDNDGELWISFDIHPDIHNVDAIVRREAKVLAKRTVKSSNSTREKRYIVETLLRLADREWPIEISLTDRSGMTYLMLLGREAMVGRVVVDPGEEYLLDRSES
ncbi:ATP-dependent zinc protease family protein [Teredinibacter haidensis]|uniref:ATP-dependent zinc protease family protein n=1 Tax=Teredinibacter haidensis TaxID=2731755 RepID=UPI000948B2E9|nr:RimK/LysX family protein [Teredinibacter haidensis]